MARGTHTGGETEALVIGSGFGGAVVACRLAQHGFRVLVLERGRRYGKGDFPALPLDDELLPDLKRWSWPVDHGLWDVVDLKEVVSVQAAGYGGGSLVYANVHLRPPREVFDDRWPVEYRGRNELDPYFDLAATMLEVKPATQHPAFATFTKSRSLAGVAEKLGRKSQFFHPPLAISYAAGPNSHGVEQGACIGCGRCSTGCPEKAKNTLDHNYLALAERHGASVATECEVTDIVELADGRFRVDGLDHLEATAVSYEAKYVFVCAGSVHSTRLLARARLKSDAAQKRVGAGYFPGGDALGMIYDTARPQHPAVGPTITTALAHGDNPARFFLVQDGGYPNELARLLGSVRAPAWVGRNRLSQATRPQTQPVTTPAGEFRLPSLLDDLLHAASSGDFGAKVTSPQLRAAWPALLKELQGPLLLPAIVESTISASIRARYARFRLTRRWDPTKRPLSLLIALERALISRWIGTNEALGERALRAGLTQAGLRATEVLREIMGYDARGAAHRTMLLAMGRDAAPGVLRYEHATDSLIADLDLYHLASGYSNEERLMTDIARELGGELRTNPAWAFLGKPITVHNQGGCRMSTKLEHGVTRPDGAVHGYDTLFVLDGASLCTSVGVNPSATITALAERNIALFLERCTAAQPNPKGAAEYQAQLEKARAFREQAVDYCLEPPNLERGPVPFATAPLGLRFDETMRGYYSPGSERPRNDGGFRERERHGRPQHSWRVDLRLSTDNLLSFFEDETHALRALGTIELVMPGAAQARKFGIEAGRVELMVPRYKPHGVPAEDRERLVAQEFALRGQAEFERLTSDELARLGTPEFRERQHRTIAGAPPPRAERFLKYWLPFSCDGERFMLYGYKRVKDDPGFDAWRDTASLFSGLYRTSATPDTASAPKEGLVGAGVLHVDMNDFLFAQLPSMAVAEGVDPERPQAGTSSRDRPDAVDPARAAWALGKFAWFFFGSLQRVYLPEFGKLVETFFGLSEGSRPQ